MQADILSRSSHFAFKQRNFDPETRQHRRREAGEAGEDTVEKAVEGLAERIIQEDEVKRAEELVRRASLFVDGTMPSHDLQPPIAREN